MLILLSTALLTGFLVPYVLRRIDESRSIAQKVREAGIARQARLIDAQSNFLDETTEVLWAWRYLSMKVAYDASTPVDEMYAASVLEYQKGIWDILSRLRNQTSKARRLVSESGYQRMVALYDQIVELDGQIDGLIRSQMTRKARTEAFSPIQERLRNEMTEKLDGTLYALAKEVQLLPEISNSPAR
ncbi:MAG TPA: hypothetical protein PLW68_03085 [Casimicrobiaceae bacterium]|nr:hypothetical protein [Casimicrobiaceae bacterium]